MHTTLRNKIISKSTALRRENPHSTPPPRPPQFNVASDNCPGITLSFEDTTTLLPGEGEGKNPFGCGVLENTVLGFTKFFGFVDTATLIIHLCEHHPHTSTRSD